MRTPERFVPAILLASCCIAATLAVASSANAAPGDTELISVPPVVGQADGGVHPGISPDGRFVVYAGVQGERIHLRDRLTGVIELIDVGMNGEEPNDVSWSADVSPDGRFVAFESWASNLVSGDSNGNIDVFVRDRQNGTTERISVGPSGEESNGSSWSPRISADGLLVAYSSWASNLVQGDTNNGPDIFLRDRQTAVNELITVGHDGKPANGDPYAYLYLYRRFGLSEDGRYVAFASNATNLTQGFNANGLATIYVRDRSSSITEPVSVTPSGLQPNGASLYPEISADGRFVVFTSAATDIAPGAASDGFNYDNVFLRDRDTGVNEHISKSPAGAAGNHQSLYPDVSADGRFVVFYSAANNLVSNYTSSYADIYVRDRLVGTMQSVSRTTTGALSPGRAYFYPKISSDGRFVVFATWARLLPLDVNWGELDIYLHELASGDYSLTPTSLAFGNRTLTTSHTRGFWLQNVGPTTVPIIEMRLSGKNPKQFSLAHTCGSSVAIGTGCTIKVTFRPTWAGEKSAVLVMRAGAIQGSYRLTGNAVVSAFTLSPKSVYFGSVRVNTTSPAQSVTITNTGLGVLPIGSITRGGANRYQFTTWHDCSSYVAVGGHCTATVRFKPTSTGAKSAYMNVWAAGGAGGKSVPLYGTGR